MIQRYPCIIIIGPPGAGKSTIAKALSKSKKIFSVDISSIARQMQKDNNLDPDISKCIERGIPLSPKLNYQLVHNIIKNSVKNGTFNPQKQIMISGGNFGTADNAAILKTILDIKHIILLKASDKIVKLRINKQAIDQKRKDNKKPIIARRINVYRKNISTDKLTSYYHIDEAAMGFLEHLRDYSPSRKHGTSSIFKNYNKLQDPLSSFVSESYRKLLYNSMLH